MFAALTLHPEIKGQLTPAITEIKGQLTPALVEIKEQLTPAVSGHRDAMWTRDAWSPISSQ